ncbi:MAG: hypothetical protein ACK4YY_17450, partial [Dolichospermum sp.]
SCMIKQNRNGQVLKYESNSLLYVEDVSERNKSDIPNPCSAGILPAKYVPHNTGKCCIYPKTAYLNLI